MNFWHNEWWKGKADKEGALDVKYKKGSLKTKFRDLSCAILSGRLWKPEDKLKLGSFDMPADSTIQPDESGFNHSMEFFISIIEDK